MNPAPYEAPPPAEGCEWKHTTELREGDLVYAGHHDLFGEREAFFHRIFGIAEKPKTFSVKLVPTHPRLTGFETRRFRKDEWVQVKV
jgi:hypothetical protein